MKPLQRILATTDLSAPSRHAVDRGFYLAKTSGAAYHVLHVLPLESLDVLHELLGTDIAPVRQKLKDQAHEQLKQWLDDPAHHLGVSASSRVMSGQALETILEQADALDAELLIVGARGESFLRHFLLGSTASQLLRKALARPVLVVKQSPHRDYQRIIIPVDFSPSSLTAIRFARRLAPQAEPVLLHAFDVPFEGKLLYAGLDDSVIQHYRQQYRQTSTQQLHQLAADAGLAANGYSIRIHQGDAAQHIIAEEQEQDADLILIGKHGKHIAEQLLLGSVTKHILAESQCDVAVISEMKKS